MCLPDTLHKICVSVYFGQDLPYVQEKMLILGFPDLILHYIVIICNLSAQIPEFMLSDEQCTGQLGAFTISYNKKRAVNKTGKP